MSRIVTLLLFVMPLFISACSEGEHAGADKAVGPGAQPPAAAQPDYIVTYSRKGEFDEVKEYLVDAITNRGIVINNTSHISNMLQRTGGDVGATTRVYQKAEVIEFCSAIISREMMEADASNIIFCPYTIAIYVLPQQPDTVYLSYRRPYGPADPASQQSLRAVQVLLDSIIKETIR